MSKHINLWGSIVGFALSSLGIALDAFSVSRPFKIDWLWLALLGFLIFIFFCYRWIFSLNKRVDELEDKMPKVTLLNPPSAEWFYDWNYLTHNLDPYVKDKIQVNGIRVLMHASVINKGWESTKILASFTSEDGEKYNLFGEQSVLLEGRGTILNTEFIFNFPTKSDFPKRGTKIKGLLTIEAWGDKTQTYEITCLDTNRADLLDEVIQQITRAVK
jgi:hypothetical protein